MQSLVFIGGVVAGALLLYFGSLVIAGGEEPPTPQSLSELREEFYEEAPEKKLVNG